MDQFDRYVRWLRLLLQTEQRDDIIRELSEEYQSQVAEKEAGLGRPLNRDEHTALIAQFGHPLLMAARYRTQEHLIGPVVYPFYWPALKVTIALAVAVHLVAGLVMIATDTPLAEVARSVGQVWGSVLAIFAWVTIMFAALDHFVRSGALKCWNPAVVPPAPHHAVTGAVFVYFLLTLDHQWVVWRNPAEARTGVRIDWINYAFSGTFVFAVACGAFA